MVPSVQPTRVEVCVGRDHASSSSIDLAPLAAGREDATASIHVFDVWRARAVVV